MKIAAQSVDCGGGARSQHLDIPIREILRITGNLQRQRMLSNKCAISDPLDTAGNDEESTVLHSVLFYGHGDRHYQHPDERRLEKAAGPNGEEAKEKP